MLLDSFSFYNRHRKKITIERISPLEFKISDGDELWANNMKEFKPEWQDLVVEKIKFSEDCSAILSCKYTKEISWVKVK